MSEIKRLRIENMQLKMEIAKLTNQLNELMNKNRDLEATMKSQYFVPLITHIFNNLKENTTNKYAVKFYSLMESMIITTYIKYPVVFYIFASIILACMLYALYHINTFIVIAIYAVEFAVMVYLWKSLLSKKERINKKLLTFSSIVLFWVSLIDIMLKFGITTTGIESFVGLFDKFPIINWIIYLITFIPKYILATFNVTLSTVFIIPRLLSIIFVIIVYYLRTFPYVFDNNEQVKSLQHLFSIIDEKNQKRIVL